MKITHQSDTRFFFAILFAAFAPAIAVMSWYARAEEAPRQASEYQVKAAFILNFGRFTEWPTNAATQPINLCVVGHDPFGHDLDKTVENQSIHGRSVRVVRDPKGESLETCQILYLGTLEGFSSLLAAARRTQTLTVSDAPGFLEDGGMVQLYLEGDHVRFSVNLRAAKDAGLQLSSKLLQIAKVVE